MIMSIRFNRVTCHRSGGSSVTPLHVPHPFVGREGLLEALDRVRDDTRREGGQCRILVHGIAGIGSSGLAAAVTDRWQDSFPDGVLHLVVGDGSGPAAGGLLRSALIQLGYPPRELPDSEADQAAIYRQRIAGKRVLAVFDGVSFADQVTHLVPSSASAAVIVTARRELRTLVTQGWRPVRVPALDPDASRVLLRAMLRADFDTIDASTVASLLRTCAGHPLALRVVGGALAGQPEYAGRLAADMGEVGIGALEVEGVPLVLAVLDSVYDSLTESLRSAYRQLSANPGPDLGLDAAAVLLDTDTAATQRTVRALLDANLLERHDGGRVGFHPMIRDHARLKARTESLDDAHDRQHKIITWYRDTGVNWESRLTTRWRESEAYRRTLTAGRAADPATRRQALDWLIAEWTNIVTAVTVAADIRSETRPTDQIAVDLGFVLWTPLHLLGYSNATMDALRSAVEAARRLGDLAAVMQLTSQLGTGYFAVGDLDAADECFAESGTLAERLRHGLGRQSALEWRGKVAAARQHFEDALRYFDDSEAIVRIPATVDADQVPRVMALLALHRARVFNARSEYTATAALLPDAIRFFAGSGEGDNHAKVLSAYGMALLGLGDTIAAREQLYTALDLFQADTSLRRQAETHALLADAYTGHPDEARAHLGRAEEIYRELDDPRRLHISARLRVLEPGPGNE